MPTSPGRYCPGARFRLLTDEALPLLNRSDRGTRRPSRALKPVTLNGRDPRIPSRSAVTGPQRKAGYMTASDVTSSPNPCRKEGMRT
jgi:hypothetical protein